MLEDKREDLAQSVYAILEDVYIQSPWTYQQVLTDLSQPQAEYFYVYEDGEMVGFLSLQHLVGECELTNIAVKKSHQSKGFGERLMTFLVDLGVPVFLEVRESNRSAQTLYAKFGFEVVGKRKNYYQAPSEDAILMKRDRG